MEISGVEEEKITANEEGGYIGREIMDQDALFRNYLEQNPEIQVIGGENANLATGGVGMKRKRGGKKHKKGPEKQEAKRRIRERKALEKQSGGGKEGEGGVVVTTDPSSEPLVLQYYKGLGFPRDGEEEEEGKEEGAQEEKEKEKEEEWKCFAETLRRPLPNFTFRITRGGEAHPFSNAIRELIEVKTKDILSTISSSSSSTEPSPSSSSCLVSTISPPVVPLPLSWYPFAGFGWRFDASRELLREHPILRSLQQLLITLSDQGHITRQEEVSMLPPLFLDVLPHHKVLDLCAAPGSKTSQLLEALHQRTDFSSSKSIAPVGVVIANDVDSKRCYTLIHQTNRISSPSLVVTNHEASSFPVIQDFSIPIPVHKESDPLGNPIPILKYDRILCDVPCTSDGTLRKNKDIWKRWIPNMPNGIHLQQLSITWRAARLLRVGGQMVYSTCSLNPVEDEAVIAELLRRSQGALEIVDLSSQLPLLKRAKGLTSWKVWDKEGEVFTWYTCFSQLPEHRQEKIGLSVFPPTSEEVKSFNLQRCIRIFPHQQDTGGFFLALLRKTKEIQFFNSRTGQQEEDRLTDRCLFSNSGRTPRTEAPFLRIPPEFENVIDLLKEFYGISEEFPFDQLMVRSEHSAKKIYFVSPACNSILDAQRNNELLVVNSGVKLFKKRHTEGFRCDYRICIEALPYLLPFLSSSTSSPSSPHSKRVIPITREDFALLVNDEDTRFTEFPSKTQLVFEALEPGCAIVTTTLGEARIAVPVWRGRSTIRLLAPKDGLVTYRNALLGFNTSSSSSSPPLTSSSSTASASLS